MTPDELLDQIDHVLEDWEDSHIDPSWEHGPDVMRWSPVTDEAAEQAGNSPWLNLRDLEAAMASEDRSAHARRLWLNQLTSARRSPNRWTLGRRSQDDHSRRVLGAAAEAREAEVVLGFDGSTSEAAVTAFVVAPLDDPARLSLYEIDPGIPPRHARHRCEVRPITDVPGEGAR